MIDYRLGLMCGTDLPIPELQLVVHQPKMKEIALIGEQDFLTGAQCLCINKSILMDNSIPEDTNNFQIFMMVMKDEQTADKKAAVQQVLTLLFPDSKVVFTPRSLIVQPQGAMIDEDNFEILQGVLEKVFCFDSEKRKEDTFNPANKKAKEIAEKLMRGRKRVAELNDSANVSIFSQYLSTLTVGLNSMSLEDCINLTMYQLYDLIERYSLYINWDIDIRGKLAGAKSDKKVENWMKNIH